VRHRRFAVDVLPGVDDLDDLADAELGA